jgi:flagellar protein FliS
MNPYFEQMILSASPIELVRMLFQRAISKVREARGHLKENRIEERASAINAAYMVVAELLSSINAGEAPDLAQKLESLYRYVQMRLVEANLNQTDAPMADVLGVLTTLAEAWIAIPDVATGSETKPSPWELVPGDRIPVAFTA